MLKFLAFAAVLAAAPLSAETTLVTADRMVDVMTGRMVEAPAILVVDRRIAAVGGQGAVAAPAGTKTVDLKGLTLVPGFIDMHTHLTSDPSMQPFEALLRTDSYWVLV